MHEWLEALQKSAKTTSPGVPAEELRRAETEAGVPLPGELGDLYSAFNGGTFEGEVVLYPLHGEGEQASVLEKTRKMLVGLPVAGVWRFGLKGEHRHLYTARKSALVQQGDNGGKMPEWVQALGDEDWIYATWDDAKGEARFYRSLSNMLSVLVPPVEKEEFGETTFARAIAAVQGALSELAGGEEEGEEQAEGQEEAEGEEGGEVQELEYDYEEELKAADAALAEIDAQLQKPAVIAADRRMEKLPKPAARKKAPRKEKPAETPAAKRDTELEKPAVIAAERRMESLTGKATREQPAAPRKKAAARTAAKKATAKKAGAKKAPAKKVPAKKAAAKKAPARKMPARKAAAKKAPARKAPAKKASAKKAPTRRGR